MKSFFIAFFLSILLLATAMMFYEVKLLQDSRTTKEETETVKMQIADVQLNMPEEGAGGEKAAVLMDRLQRYLDKLHYSASNTNWKLVAYYLNAMENIGQELHNSGEDFDGKNLAKLWKESSGAELDILKDLVDLQGKEALEAVLDNLTKSCNSCHKKVGLPFVKITESGEAFSYSQDFSAPPPEKIPTKPDAAPKKKSTLKSTLKKAPLPKKKPAKPSGEWSKF